jgi:predicted small secreted protein
MFCFIRLVSALVLAGLLASCATTSGAGGQASSGDGVSLRFAWPDGFTAQVSSKTSESQGGNAPQLNERRYEISLEGTGQERKLITRRPPATGPGVVPAELQLPPIPTIVLGPTGELKRIEGTDLVLAELFKDAESQGIPAAQQELLAKLVGQAFEQASRDRWEELIGRWNGLTLKPGEVVERKSRLTMPLYANSVDTRARMALKERVPCIEGSTEKRCVRLVLDSSLDPSGTERAGIELVQRMRDFMKANSDMPDSELPELKVTKLQLDGSFELIAEPETLIPYHLRDALNATIVMQSVEGETQDFKLQSERVELFTPGSR